MIGHAQYDKTKRLEYQRYVSSHEYVQDLIRIMSGIPKSEQYQWLCEADCRLPSFLPLKAAKDLTIKKRKNTRPNWLPEPSAVQHRASFVYKTLSNRKARQASRAPREYYLRCLEDKAPLGTYSVWLVAKDQGQTEEHYLSYCIVVETKREVGVAVLNRFFMFGNTENEMCAYGYLALQMCVEWLTIMFCESHDYKPLTALKLDLCSSDTSDYRGFLKVMGFRKENGRLSFAITTN
jgi:hypothetical protein